MSNEGIALEKTYIGQLDLWCRDKAEDLYAYFPAFCETVEDRAQILVYCDARIVMAVVKLLKSYQYIQFSSEAEHRSPLKTKLKEVVKVLREFDFISMHDCHKLMNHMQKNYLRERIAEFLKHAEASKKEGESEPYEIQLGKLWKHKI